ncbi:hypothetical protein L195_g006778 [Trifolium pratense]|uniref:Uncharacterized protein n=1 Tax=Trifolium pratense TaxID=57577 RepID=A0A2K3NW41_TRIPR|nr:hypothetical protein L195_g003721 [Trifolium pratense]PNY10208.1 hypothetical protein L195_g006778 [Trifolium pratense]
METHMTACATTVLALYDAVNSVLRQSKSYNFRPIMASFGTTDLSKASEWFAYCQSSGSTATAGHTHNSSVCYSEVRLCK